MSDILKDNSELRNDKGKLLLLVDSDGNIGKMHEYLVFSTGDEKIFEISHQCLLHKNIFSIGMISKTLLRLSMMYPKHLLASQEDFKIVQCEIIRRQSIPLYLKISKKEFTGLQQIQLGKLLKRVTLRCSIVKMKMQNMPIGKRVISIKNSQLASQSNYCLTLIEARESPQIQCFKQVSIYDIDFAFRSAMSAQT